MSTSILRDSTTSLYEQIAYRLREEIQRGDFEPSGKLPSEAELGQRFGVSRVTVRLAVGKLSDDGVVERKQGKGTFVSAKQVRHGLDALRSFHEALLLQGLKPSMRVISHTEQPVPEALRELFGGAGRCLLLERLHFVDEEPIALGRSHLPAELASVVWTEVETQPIYSVLETVTGMPVSRADLAIRAQAADKSLAGALNVKRGTALLVMERTSYFANGHCCDRTTFYIRPERYAFVLSGVFKSSPIV
ncbi:GntR family transcriptional regulator [Pseudomonas sp. Bout1]|uniref:GntR family transcriptional regulator n=1 Tax=Pseudomonas sp. Bout1 TaxID=3048600 RepID=UPI002AB55725|nr:GntR family transcriptional regulator [Pseudomonas sp. Bout1]MDY7533183.1 GntR family transcriptional regulator [Pseudomonas sp. Bout1]MEB0183748.1 GntR family transcriptional regulator [Pseudomonas sp. Bout1]